jgi:hypothetical protein
LKTVALQGELTCGDSLQRELTLGNSLLAGLWRGSDERRTLADSGGTFFFSFISLEPRVE